MENQLKTLEKLRIASGNDERPTLSREIYHLANLVLCEELDEILEELVNKQMTLSGFKSTKKDIFMVLKSEEVIRLLAQRITEHRKVVDEYIN